MIAGLEPIQRRFAEIRGDEGALVAMLGALGGGRRGAGGGDDEGRAGGGGGTVRVGPVLRYAGSTSSNRLLRMSGYAIRSS